jgi:hypothetical protein
MSHSPQEKPRDWMEQFAAMMEGERNNASAFIKRLNDRCIPYRYSDGRVLVESKATREDEK